MTTPSIQRIIDILVAKGQEEYTRPQILEIAKQHGVNADGFMALPTYRIRRGVYSVKQFNHNSNIDMARTKTTTEPSSPLVPQVDPTYVPFGFFKDLVTIIKSNSFYPVYIEGLSGNGKTVMVEQACAKLNREAIRVNISIETDEDDLIGGNTLINGNIVFREGPVITAMKRGAILILDEIDRGSNKLMCMQAILEGKPYFNKKTNEMIHAAKGFNVIATGNTKGQGSEDGKFISAQILDDAFLERFAITVEQEYPSAKIEKRIIMNKMNRAEKIDEEFADKLVSWADIIRKSFKEGAVDEIISTRRLEHIVNAYAMFNNRTRAIQLCISRFNDETRTSFLDLYTKIDAQAEAEKQETVPEPTDNL